MEAKLLLKYLIKEEGTFTLEWLNQRINEFELGYMEVKNRPTAIAKKVLDSNDHSLRQNGQQVLCSYYYSVLHTL